MTNYLHLANPDKFTLPLCDFLINKQGLSNHNFLFITDQFDKQKYKSSHVMYLNSPIRSKIFRNISVFYNLCFKSDIIIMHGASGVIFFNLFPWFTKKLVWVINGAELYNQTNENASNNYVKSVLKKVKVHVSHIEGDSILANELLKSKANFHYSPMYLSNVVSTTNFIPSKINGKVKIMIGNSTSMNNDHISIFNKIKKYEHDIEYILCPLSYGIYQEYKESVKEEGFKLFGDKFKPIEEFLTMDKYIDLLQDIDIAVFNHWRQEAMGVTLTLLSLGKIVYVNPNTTSFKSLVNRGFQIFDNNLLFNYGLFQNHNVDINKSLLEKYYSLDNLLESLNNIQLK